MSVAANIPVGAIVAYCGNRDSLKTTTWRVCDGARLEQKQYPELFAMIGKANGGDDTSFQIPDLRGRFLRGAAENGGYQVGQKHDFKTANSKVNFRIEMFNIPNNVQNTSVSKGAQIQMMDVYYRDFDVQLSGNDKETRPDNMYMDFIIKTHNVAEKKRVADLVPGSVFPFTGEDQSGPKGSVDAQYVLCDGNNVVASRYPALKSTVGNRFAVDKQLLDSFTPPNLKNLFIRGIDDSGKVDPDYASRKAAPDGTPDGRGTTQSWATHIKNPRYSLNALNQTKSSTSGCTKALGQTGIAGREWRSDATIIGGDEETRPANAAVRFYLNAVGPAANVEPNIPIGGIIALPGTPNISNVRYYDPFFTFKWIKCDGQWVDSESFPELEKLYKNNLWKSNSNGDQGTFQVPDLRSKYLRGTGPNERATATFQEWATGRPKNLNNNNLGDWPHDPWDVARGGGNRIFDATGTRSFNIQADWDSETAPASVAVDFYVRGA